MSIKIMSEVWGMRDLTPPQKLVFLSLADNANDCGLCYPSAMTTSARTGLSESTTRRAIADLEKLGHLSRRFQTGKATFYNLHPCQSDTPVRVTPLPQKSVPLSQKQLTPVTEANITVSNHQETSIKRTDSKTSKQEEAKATCQAIVDLYHKILPELPKVKLLTDKRKSQVKTCSTMKPTFATPDFWEAYFSSVRNSAFHMGQNDRGWTADFDWLTNKTNFVKMYERGCQ